MTSSRFHPGNTDAIVFDVIGTLVDEDTTWLDVSEQISAMADLGTTSQVHQHWAAALDDRMSAVVYGQAPWQPHQQLVDESARQAIVELGGTPTAETAVLTASLDATYLAWPDVAGATTALRRHCLVAGVSNGDLDSLARLSNLSAISWDVVLSTAAVRTYKPAPAAYEYAIRTLRIDPARTLFVASHPWDLRAAAEHGFRTAYVARPGAERPTADDRFYVAVDDLDELAALFP